MHSWVCYSLTERNGVHFRFQPSSLTSAPGEWTPGILAFFSWGKIFWPKPFRAGKGLLSKYFQVTLHPWEESGQAPAFPATLLPTREFTHSQEVLWKQWTICWLMVSAEAHAQLTSSFTLGAPLSEWCRPQWTGLFHINNQSRQSR